MDQRTSGNTVGLSFSSIIHIYAPRQARRSQDAQEFAFNWSNKDVSRNDASDSSNDLPFKVMPASKASSSSTKLLPFLY